MKMTNVKSSAISAIGYEKDTLGVTFSTGKTYMYKGVPKKTYTALTKAESKGTYFMNEIRPKYEGKLAA